jgi:hypothetical protein
MISNQRSDPLMTMLASLPRAVPDDARADRTRARCRQALARRVQGRTRPHAGLPVAWALCAAYLADLLWTALAFYR